MSEASEAAAAAADTILRHVSEWYVRKDVNEAQIDSIRRDIQSQTERIMDRFDAQDQRLANLETDAKTRRNTATASLWNLVVGIGIGVAVALILRAVGG